MIKSQDYRLQSQCNRNAVKIYMKEGYKTSTMSYHLFHHSWRVEIPTSNKLIIKKSLPKRWWKWMNFKCGNYKNKILFKRKRYIMFYIPPHMCHYFGIWQSNLLDYMRLMCEIYRKNQMRSILLISHVSLACRWMRIKNCFKAFSLSHLQTWIMCLNKLDILSIY